MTRVLVACGELRAAFGGIRVYTDALVRHLAAVPGVEVGLLADHAADVAHLPADLRRVVIGAWGGNLNYLSWAVVPPKTFRGYDIVHVPLTAATVCLSRGLFDPHGPKLVMTCHDLIPVLMPEYRLPILDAYYKLWLPRVHRHARGHLADSEYTKADMVRHFGLPADRIRVSYLGANVPAPPRTPPPAGPPYFLAVSSVEPRKNFPRVIGAFRRFQDHHPGWPGRLKIVGRQTVTYGGDTASRLARLVAERPGTVELLGHISDADLHALYQSATGLVYPSLYEGFGLPVLEAMAAGCPVVCSNTTSLPEVGGDAVVYCDPLSEESIAAGLGRLAIDPALRADLVRRGGERAKLFSWRKHAEDAVDVYRRVLAGRPVA